MKHLTSLIILLCSLVNHSSSYAQQWNWGNLIGGTSPDNNSCLYTDFQGNVIAGAIGSNNFTLGGQNYVSPGTWTVISSFTQGGVLNWQKVFLADSSNYSVKILSLSGDSNNFIYASGSYVGEIDFGSGTVLNSGIGNTNAFLAKLDQNGNVIWVQDYGQTSNSETAVAIEAYSNQRIYALLLRGLSTRLLKYNAAGNLVNTIIPTGIGSGVSFYANALKVKGDRIYICGSAMGQTNFSNNVVIGIPSSGSVFILCCDTNGMGLWSRSYPIFSTSSLLDIDVNDSNHIMAVGSFQGQLIIDNDTLQSAGSHDGFLILTDSTGKTITKRRFGSTIGDNLYGVASASNATWYVSGQVNAGGINLTTNLLGIETSSSFDDVFVARLNSAGLAEWVKVGNHNQIDNCRSFAYDSQNQLIYTGGYLQGSSVWGSSNLVGIGFTDAFFAQLSDTTPAHLPYVFPEVLIDSTANPSCPGLCNAYFSSTYNSSHPPLSLALNDVPIIQQDLFSLCPNNYTLSVTDSNDVSISIDFNIAAADSIFINTVLAYDCDSGNYVMEAVPSGGTPPYAYLWPDGSQASTFSVSAADTSTTVLLVSDANACSASFSNQLLPYVPLSTTLLQQGNVLYFSPPTNNFQWFENGNALAITDTFYIVTSNGTYWIELMDAYGCTSSTDTLNVVVSSLYTTFGDAAIKAVPNPGTGLFYLQHKFSASPLIVEVFGSEGHLVKCIHSGKDGLLDLLDCPGGFYVLKVYAEALPPQYLCIVKE